MTNPLASFPHSSTPDHLEFVDLSNGERSRTYVFPGGDVKIDGVSRLCVRPSGTHRLETADGSKYIIPTGWIALKIDAKEWSL